MDDKAPQRRPLGPMLGVIACALANMIVFAFLHFRSPPGSPTSRPSVATPWGGASGQTSPITWYIVAFAVAAPTLIISRVLRYRWRRQRRRITGRCLSCGYDLRGSTDQCPECGSTFLEQFPPDLD